MKKVIYAGRTLPLLPLAHGTRFRFASSAVVASIVHWLDVVVKGRQVKIPRYCSASDSCFMCKAGKLEGMDTSYIAYSLVEHFDSEFQSLGLALLRLSRGICDGLTPNGKSVLHPEHVTLNHMYHVIHYVGQDTALDRTKRNNYRHVDVRLAYRDHGSDWTKPVIEALPFLNSYEETEKAYRDAAKTRVDAGLSNMVLELMEP